jgi:hypothetical protein
MESPLFGVGHNQPPASVEILRENLQEKNEPLLSRYKDLVAAADQTPVKCEDEELAKTITERIKLIRTCANNADAIRTAEKEPFMTLERAVDGFFQPIIKTLQEKKQRLERTLGDYHEKIAAEKRRLAEEEARKAREEAARKAREAQELEAAVKAAREAEEKRRREAAEKAERERLEAEAAERRRKEAAETAARQAREAEEAAKRAAEEENTKKRKAAEAEAKRKREEAEKSERERIAAEEEAKRKKDEATASQQESTRLESKAVEEPDNMAPLVNTLLDEVAAAEKRATNATRQAEANPGKLSVTHGNYGSRSSLRQKWKGKIIDREAIDWAAIGPHISDQALQVALNSWIEVNAKGEGTPQLAGCELWRENVAQVR